MGANNRPKVEIGLNDSATLTLLKDKALVGENTYGPYFMYNVSQDGLEKVLFATADVHKQVLEAGLKTGDVFQLTKVSGNNGKKVTSKVEFEVLQKNERSSEVPAGGSTGELRDVLLQCVKDADYIIQNAGVQVSDETQKLAATLFIAKTRTG